MRGLSAESARRDNNVCKTNEKYPENQDVARNSHLANGSYTKRNGSRVDTQFCAGAFHTKQKNAQTQRYHKMSIRRERRSPTAEGHPFVQRTVCWCLTCDILYSLNIALAMYMFLYVYKYIILAVQYACSIDMYA